MLVLWLVSGDIFILGLFVAFQKAVYKDLMFRSLLEQNMLSQYIFNTA